MERLTEPELMLDEEQALAYARADFEEPHQQVLVEFQGTFAPAVLDGHLLDLGCGPGDVTFRFARAFPRARLIAVDGSPAMLALARQRAAAEPEAGGRITFLEGLIPATPLPELTYQAIISNSLLHHLQRPQGLWTTVRRYGGAGTRVFIYDLRRPGSVEEARALVERYAAQEPEILRHDFYHSLLAAFTVAEVQQQLREAGLAPLAVRGIGDRHLLVHGTLTG
jgi:ubiquinone/menaquinone biosynthesis C-methylase UbiE